MKKPLTDEASSLASGDVCVPNRRVAVEAMESTHLHMKSLSAGVPQCRTVSSGRSCKRTSIQTKLHDRNKAPGWMWSRDPVWRFGQLTSAGDR